MKTKLYVASSWKNMVYGAVCEILTTSGFECLDWRNPPGENTPFRWSQIGVSDPEKTGNYIEIINNSERATDGFNSDFSLMQQADQCVLLLPCGKSAHFEAGWFWGQKKPIHVFFTEPEVTPELMYLGATSINGSLDVLITNLRLSDRIRK